MTDFDPLINAPFQPITTEEKSNLEKLQDKIKEGGELNDKERNVINIALKVLRQAFSDKVPYVPFICGEAGKKGKDGMPEYFMICPNYGLDGFAVYKKDTDYGGPTW
jgi:hypothetical protein